MDPSDKELREQLGRDPFGRSGFDGRLRRKIEERIESEQRRERLPRNGMTWQLPLAAFGFFAVVLFSLWLWNDRARMPDQMEAANEPSAPRMSASASPSAVLAEQPKKYALLLGLRSDRTAAEGDTTSTYRTVLIAAEQDPQQLRLKADIQGLYMPYKQNFWKIASVESADGRQTLQAIQATNRKSKTPDKTVHVPDYVLSERIVYAGNEYLSIDSKVKDGQGGTDDRWWVKHIAQINLKPDDPSEEPHTLLADVLPDQGTAGNGAEQWSIYRNPGEWVSELYDPVTGEGQQLRNLPKKVIQNDVLLMKWTDIEALEPTAKDAFTYGNVLGVVTDKDIRVRAMQDGAPVSEPVTVPLSKGESVIMIQWAQNDKIDYVDKWIKDFQFLSAK